MLPREYDWIAAALRGLHEAELRSERKRDRRQRWIRKWIRLRVIMVVILCVMVTVGALAMLLPLALGEPSYSIRVTLRNPDGRPIITHYVDLMMIDGSKRGRPTRLYHSADGVYADGGIGIACETCDVPSEIRAPGYEPFRLKMADHCTSWDGKVCLDVALTATLTPAAEPAAESSNDANCDDKCPPGAICDPVYIFHLDVRDPRGHPLGCNFDLVSPRAPADERRPQVHRQFGSLPDGTCSLGRFGKLSISAQFEVRAVGYEPARFTVADWCQRPHCGNCLKADVKLQLDPLP